MVEEGWGGGCGKNWGRELEREGGFVCVHVGKNE